MTRRSKLSYTAALSQWWRAPTTEACLSVPEFLNTVHVGERTCPISKAHTPNPIAQPAIPSHKTSTNAFRQHFHAYISEQRRTIPPNRLSVQREQGVLSIGQLWTWFVDFAILRWLGRSLRCGSSPLEDIFENAERGADDARYGMLRIHRCFQALLCGRLECS